MRSSPRSGQISSPGKWCMSHELEVFWERFDGNIRFLTWPEERPRSGHIRSHFKLRIFFKNMPIWSIFVQGFEKCHLFSCATVKNAMHCLNKWRHQLHLFRALHKQRCWFEILHTFAGMWFCTLSLVCSFLDFCWYVVFYSFAGMQFSMIYVFYFGFQ